MKIEVLAPQKPNSEKINMDISLEYLQGQWAMLNEKVSEKWGLKTVYDRLMLIVESNIHSPHPKEYEGRSCVTVKSINYKGPKYPRGVVVPESFLEDKLNESDVKNILEEILYDSTGLV